MTLSHANLFRGKFKHEFLQTLTVLPLVWWKFIDGVFAIWTHGELALHEFLQELNQYHVIIKFTDYWSTKEVTLLDIRVYIKDNCLETDLYTKPTNKHQYLQIDSYHPRHCKTAIPYSQALSL